MGVLTGMPRSLADVPVEVPTTMAPEPIRLTAEVLQSMPVILFRLDAQGTFVELLGAGQSRFGRKDGELLGRKAAGEFPQMRPAIEQALAGESVRFKCQGTLGDNPWAFDTLLTFDRLHGSGAIGFAIDVTDHQQAEECVEKHRGELAHIDRVKTVEQMASGIAHELNQPLAAMVVRADVAAEKIRLGRPQSDQQLIDSLEQIAKEAYRAGCIIQRMKEFVKKTEPHRSSIDMASITGKVVALLESDLRHARITLTTDVDRSLPKILADGIQVQQVLLNLIRNAMDAIENKDANVTQSDDSDPSCTTSSDSNAKEIVVRSRVRQDILETIVRDNGCGIGGEQAEQCFETFYTTKCEGMGMGLAISRSIVEAHGGRIWCEQNTDRGTTFSFTMPLPKEEQH